MKQKYSKILSLIGLSFFVANLVLVVATPVMIYAQAVPTPTATTPPPTATTTPPVAAGEGEKSIEAFLCTPGTGIYTCINKLYRFALAVAFFITVFFIVIAGYQYMLGGEKGKENAKGQLSAAVVAIVILSTSYILLRQINPDLVEFKKIDPLPVDLVSKLDDLDPNRGGDIPTLDQWEQGPNSNNGTGTPGADIKNCPTPGPVAIPTDVAGRAGEKACQNLIDALRSLRQAQGVNFIVTDAFGDGHQSICHRVSGTCADMVPTGNTNWEALCKGVVASGQFRILNEYSGNDAPTCGVYKNYGNKDHLHIILQNTADDLESGTSGEGSGFSTGSGGSRPNCIVIQDTPGMCAHPSGTAGRYEEGDFSSANPALLTAYTALKASFPRIEADQVYRSPQYGAHMRSVFEGKALLSGWSEAEVRSYGQYCQSMGIQYVSLEDVKNENTKKYILAHFPSSAGGHFGSLQSPTTCNSDHGTGIAFDLKSGNETVTEAGARAAGLCHSVPIFTAHNTRMNADTRHWALISALPNGTSSCVSY